MPSQQALIVEPSSLFNSQAIQIIHKHPDFSHKIRSDLDPYEFIACSYPIALANKIIPFLQQPVTPIVRSRSRSRSPKRQRPELESPPRRARRNIDAKIDSNVQSNVKTVSPIKPLPSENSTPIIKPIAQSLTTLPTPSLTPSRQFSPPESCTPATVNTAYTSRTISPGGTAFSPLKPLSITLPGVHLNQSQSNTANPSIVPPRALFTPPKPPSTANTTKATALTTTVTQKTNRARNPPPLIHFEEIPTSLDYRNPLPTLCLRHDLPTQSLRDILEWCLVSTQVGRIVELTEWMIQFRDTNRVRGIIEVCRELRLKRMGRVAERLLERMESGFGTI